MSEKRDLLQEEIRHVDITSLDSRPVIDAMRGMSFSSRDTARAADIFCGMLRDTECSVILTLAGSTSAGGCMQVYRDMVRLNMVDAVVATGASIVDMDFFEALGYKHYRGSQYADDAHLRSLYIDRIYDTYIDEEQLQQCDATIARIANGLEPRPYSSREFICEMGRYLTEHGVKHESLIEECYRQNVPIFCPAFSDSSAGFGLVVHQVQNPDRHMTIDSVRDFYELTQIKIAARETGLFMVGGGVPKNFAQDTVVCAEILGHELPMHRYAVQVTVADVRDGACSSSTLREASSWGKVDTVHEQMVYAEATTVVPLIVSYAHHTKAAAERTGKAWSKLFDA